MDLDLRTRTHEMLSRRFDQGPAGVNLPACHCLQCQEMFLVDPGKHQRHQSGG